MCISPFGWGEICYRDFESFINGAVLVKPDMSHLETWPSVYEEDATYVPFSWDFSDLFPTIEELLEDVPRMEAIAAESQSRYQQLWTEEGKDAFCQRFVKLITPNSLKKKVGLP